MNSDTLINKADLHFLLFDWLKTTDLVKRARYADHSKDSFQAIIASAHTIAAEYFAPHNGETDKNEPFFDGHTISTHPKTKIAINAFADAGFLAATHDYELGGMQLPATIAHSCFALFRAANVSASTYCFLTAVNAELLLAFGCANQKARYLPPLLRGEWLGTLAVTESTAGSSIADLTTTATPLPTGRYAIKGQKNLCFRR